MNTVSFCPDVFLPTSHWFDDVACGGRFIFLEMDKNRARLGAQKEKSGKMLAKDLDKHFGDTFLAQRLARADTSNTEKCVVLPVCRIPNECLLRLLFLTFVCF